jgi:hypothetical protein
LRVVIVVVLLVNVGEGLGGGILFIVIKHDYIVIFFI